MDRGPNAPGARARKPLVRAGMLLAAAAGALALVLGTGSRTTGLAATSHCETRTSPTLGYQIDVCITVPSATLSGTVPVTATVTKHSGARSVQRLIFVIDATWGMAKKMVRVSPLLSSLPRIAFEPQKPSNYRFRRQPRPECVSTIEAIHEVIDELDREGAVPVVPSGAHSNLLEVFEWMAVRQSAYTHGKRGEGIR